MGWEAVLDERDYVGRIDAAAAAEPVPWRRKPTHYGKRPDRYRGDKDHSKSDDQVARCWRPPMVERDFESERDAYAERRSERAL